MICVLNVDWVTGMIMGYMVGPAQSRGADIKDVREHYMLGLEDEIVLISAELRFGVRYSFLPKFCMMNRAQMGW